MIKQIGKYIKTRTIMFMNSIGRVNIFDNHYYVNKSLNWTILGIQYLKVKIIILKQNCRLAVNLILIEGHTAILKL